MNIVTAITLAVAASVLFAFGTSIQHSSVGRRITDDDPSSRAIGPRRLWALLRERRWLGGLGLILIGAAMHITALTLAPVTVVQPVGILAVVWSVLLAAKLHGYRTTKMIWFSVALTVAGIVAFTALASLHASNDTRVEPESILLACLAVYGTAGALALIVKLGPDWLYCMGWASAGAILYGLSSGQLKTLTELITRIGFLHDSLFWIGLASLIPAYAFGGWLIQQAFAAGPAEVVVGSMTTIDPFVAVLFGILVLGEGNGISWPIGLAMIIAGATSIGGVVLLSRHHPDSGNASMLTGHSIITAEAGA